MTGGTIRYEYGEIRNAITSMDSFARKLEAELESLQSQLGPLKADWDAQAREAYDVAQHQWDQAVVKIRETIDDVRRTVEMGASNMAGTDQQRARAFQA